MWRSLSAQCERCMTHINMFSPACIMWADLRYRPQVHCPPPTPHNTGGVGLPELMHLNGAGCKLQELYYKRLIARGWPVAQLLEFHWGDSLLSQWCITYSRAKRFEPDINTVTLMCSDSRLQKRVLVSKVKELSRPGNSNAIINLRCLMDSRGCSAMKVTLSYICSFSLHMCPFSICQRTCLNCLRSALLYTWMSLLNREAERRWLEEIALMNDSGLFFFPTINTI